MRAAFAVLFLVLLCSPCAVSAAEPRDRETALLAEVSAHLAAPRVLRANFRQEKHIRVLSRPLVSTGRLTFAAGTGMIWRVDEPYPVSIVLTPERMIEIQGGAARRTEMSANPFYQSLTRIFLAVMAGNASSLVDQFTPEQLPAKTGWSVSLTPRDPALAGAIASIALHGARFVEEVRIREAQGDETVIAFSDFLTRPAELTSAEAADFAR